MARGPARGGIREGFDWVLKESCLTVAELDDPSGFLPVPVDGTPARVDLAKIRYHKDFVELRKEGGWLFGAQGMIAAELRLDAPGEYVVTVTAKGVPYQNVDPVMHVYVDQHYAGSTAVAPKVLKEYTFRVAKLAGGVRRVLISYWNSADHGARNLYIKEVRINSRQQPGFRPDRE